MARSAWFVHRPIETDPMRQVAAVNADVIAAGTSLRRSGTIEGFHDAARVGACYRRYRQSVLSVAVDSVLAC